MCLISHDHITLLTAVVFSFIRDLRLTHMSNSGSCGNETWTPLTHGSRL